MTTSKSKPSTSRTTTTSRRKTSTRGTASKAKAAKVTKAPAVKVSAAAVPASKKDVTPTVVTVAEPFVSAPTLRKRDLLEEVVDRSQVKRKDAKRVVEETLSVIGKAVAEGREINIPGFGKLMVQRVENKANARVAVCKIRQRREADKESLAKAEKDG